MIAMMGLEPLVSTGAEATKFSQFNEPSGSCELAPQDANDSSETFWLWSLLAFMTLLRFFVL